jgi:hypothetical protein
MSRLGFCRGEEGYRSVRVVLHWYDFLTGSLANLHITALGHGYASSEHVEHKRMSPKLPFTPGLTIFADINLSHIITEFSFGPFFPEIVQPLDNTYEITQESEYLCMS